MPKPSGTIPLSQTVDRQKQGDDLVLVGGETPMCTASNNWTRFFARQLNLVSDDVI